MKKNLPGTWLVLLAAVAVVFGAILWWSRSEPDPEAPVAASVPATAAQTPASGASGARAGAGAPTAASRGNVAVARIETGAESLTKRLRAILDLPKLHERKQGLEALGTALARHDPAQARELLKMILAERGEEGGDAYAFVSGFAADYAAANPAAAAEWAAALPLSLQFNACGFVAQHWAKADLAAATKWAERISEVSLRTNVLRRIGQELDASSDPKVVGAWAQRLSASADAALHVELIGRLWAKADSQAAFAWSTQIEDPLRRTTAVVAIAGIVAEENPSAASAWIGQFPAGPTRNQAVAVASAKWSQTDPAAAAKWVAGFGDTQLLESTIRAISARWLQKDRAAAVEWIGQAPISEATKFYLLGPNKG